MSSAQKGKVYLVGAGPGDPELLTVKALHLLQTANVVLHDDLVPDEVVALARANAEITNVGKRCGRPRITQEGIHRLMIDAARADRSVVRLKSGDPLVFGRAGEEIAALRDAEVEFEVVPGVTAAFAAGAMLSLPLTDRKSASKLIFCTGRHAADKGASPIWSGMLPKDATLVIYMPGRDMEGVSRELRNAGVAEDVPCTAVSQAATPRQSYTVGNVGSLTKMHCGPAPLLLLVGWAVEGLTIGEAQNGIWKAESGDGMLTHDEA